MSHFLGAVRFSFVFLLLYFYSWSRFGFLFFWGFSRFVNVGAFLNKKGGHYVVVVDDGSIRTRFISNNKFSFSFCRKNCVRSPMRPFLPIVPTELYLVLPSFFLWSSVSAFYLVLPSLIHFFTQSFLVLLFFFQSRLSCIRFVYRVVSYS